MSIGIDLFNIKILNIDQHVWREIKAEGFAPSDLRGYCFSQSSDNEWIIFGGEANEDISNDVYYLEKNTEGYRWYYHYITGERPAPRKNHKSVNIGKEIVYCI
jgi:hypothetical protein